MRSTFPAFPRTISVELEDGALTITGEREREREHRTEDGRYFR
jgi:HSP20 family molecular chaperone IbpA